MDRRGELKKWTKAIAAATFALILAPAAASAAEPPAGASVDTAPPVATVSVPATQPDFWSGTLYFRVTFDEPVTGLTAEDFTCGGICTGVASVSGTERSYN